MGILDGNPKNEPMHYGEIFSVWGFVLNSQCFATSLQLYKNHAGDKDLKQLLDDMHSQAKSEISECEKLLKENGITPPPSFPEKPNANLEDIPPGARIMDPEIATALWRELAASLVACSQTIAMSIREDIAAMFGKFHTEKMVLGARLLRMNKQKGWLIPPPLQVKHTEPVHA